MDRPVDDVSLVFDVDDTDPLAKLTSPSGAEVAAPPDRPRIAGGFGPLMTWAADSDGRLLDIDDRIAWFTGRSREECLDKNLLDAVHVDDRQGLRQAWRRAKRSGTPFDYEVRVEAADGRFYWHRTRAFPEPGAGDEPTWCGVMEDIHAQPIPDKPIGRALQYDHLTGVLGRAAFLAKLHAVVQHCINTDGTLSLVLVDLDQFAAINDRLGHKAGDEVLRQVARRLEDIVGTNTTVGRVGGDKFGVIVPGEIGDGASCAARIEGAFDRDFALKRGSVSVGASIGMAGYPRDAENGEALFKCAGLALNSVRAGLGPGHGFNGPARNRQQIRMAAVSVIRNALDQGLVHPYYQPKVSLATGEIMGFEALLRWEHARYGIQPAQSVVDAFDDPELATALDDHMFKRIAQDIKSWRRDGIRFGRVAFNISPVRFRHGKLAQKITRQILREGLSPHDLELEITEDVLIGRDVTDTAADLQSLSDSGLNIALDDFGTGFASLVHLKHFRIDALKIDRSFVQNLGDPRNSAIVDAILHMGRKLSIATVAEGVESEAQAKQLRRRGCDQAQGYLFAQAMPKDEVDRYLAGRKPVKA